MYITGDLVEKLEQRLLINDFMKKYKSQNEIGNFYISFNTSDMIFGIYTDYSINIFISKICESIIDIMNKSKKYSFLKFPKGIKADSLNKEFDNKKYKNVIISSRILELLQYDIYNSYNITIPFNISSINNNKSFYSSYMNYYRNEIFLFDDIYFDIKKLEIIENCDGVLDITLNCDLEIQNETIYIIDDYNPEYLELYREHMLNKLI